MNIPPIDLEPRLQSRYRQLVQQHSAPVDPLASGLRALPNGISTFAATQAAWRFFANPKVTLQRLVEPLQEHARQVTALRQRDFLASAFVLVAHDWSWIDYNGHTSKQDRRAHSHQRAQGYELLSALAICPTNGAPIAPLNLDLDSAEGVHTSRDQNLQPSAESHQEALLSQVEYVQGLDLGALCVHIIDREADTVANYRAFAQAEQLCLIRGHDNYYVEYQGRSVQLRRMLPLLSFVHSRPVLYHGRNAQQFVAEASVTLTRPYIRDRQGKREVIPGPPVTLRLVISQVRNAVGQVLACWYLYTNVPDTVPAETIALWYYYRWRIECFHKLLKSAGWQMEDWQQESASAIAKRLAVVAMATALVWQIQYSSAPEVEPLRRELVALSGRQMKKRQPVTAPALLAGLWTLLSAIELLERYTPEQLKALALQARHAMRQE
jgi:hypothetical protein